MESRLSTFFSNQCTEFMCMGWALNSLVLFKSVKSRVRHVSFSLKERGLLGYLVYCSSSFSPEEW